MRNWWKISVSFLFIQKLVCAVHVDVLASSTSRASLDSTPEFSEPIQNVTVAVGREAILSCSVTDLGHYRVAWARAEDQTILSVHTRVITHNPRITVTHDDNQRTWQLHIRQLKETDRGCYMCQINTNTMKKELGCVDVQVPPDINDTETSGDVTVTEGENATLVCKASGHPEPRILWRREDGEHLILHPRQHETEKVDTFSGSVLNLVRIDRRQMGAYLCIASNDVPPAVSKRITLNVNFAPVIKVPNQLLGAPLNSDVQLECYVEAFPNTINYWVKNKGDILMSGKKHTLTEERDGYKVHMILTIHNILRRDIGTYMCAATNSMGKTDGTIRLYEIKVAQTKQPPAQPTEIKTTAQAKVFISSTYQTTVPKTTAVVFRALLDNPMDNFIPSVKPAPLETMMSSGISLHRSIFFEIFFIILVILR